MIKANNLTIDFPMYNSSGRSIKKTMLRASTGGRIGRDSDDQTYVRSLDNLSFEFKDGERVGLVGHNGSGKTTLLRALSGVYSPTAGSIKIIGHVASLLDITLGMDIDATGYENIMMRGIVMGMSPIKMKGLMDEIAEFTELGEYLNMPLRTYSSGMQLRLAFSVSTCIEADILLMDEWISVGDSNFQDKAADRLNQLINKIPLLVIATHSPELVRKVCTRVISLEHGKINKDIDVSEY